MGEVEEVKHSRTVASPDVLRAIVEEAADQARQTGDGTFKIDAVQAILDERRLALPWVRRPARELRDFVGSIYNVDQFAPGQGGYPWNANDTVTEMPPGNPSLGLPEDLAALGYASPQTVEPGKPASVLVQKHRLTRAEAIGSSNVRRK